MRRALPSIAALALAGAACTSAKHESGPPDIHSVPHATWEILGAQRPSALMSVSGASDSDVWAVGADQGQGPMVLHWDGTAWTQLHTGTSGDLWWVQAFAGGPVYMAGAGGTILAYRDGAFTRMEVPGQARQVVYGLWGRSPEDVYAVGAVGGRAGFVWHHDGSAWSEVRLPADLPKRYPREVPGFFKVWGQGDDVWIVGNTGTILHGVGSGPLEVAHVGDPHDTYFTVSGDSTSVVVVGVQDNGILLERASDGTFRGGKPGPLPLLQGVSLLPDGTGFATGDQGAVCRRNAGGWTSTDTGIDRVALGVESLHAVWADPSGGAWAVGGSVLSSALDKGALLHFGTTHPAALPEEKPAGTPDTTCPADPIDIDSTDASVARRWDEAILRAIRRDSPRPMVHARNLFHLSAAMWDAWAAYDPVAKGYVSTEKHPGDASGRQEAVSHAAFRVLSHRYDPALAAQGAVSLDCFARLMTKLGNDPTDAATSGDSPAAVGNRIGQAILDRFADDGANEAGNYADTTGWKKTNNAMTADDPGAGLLSDASAWQQIMLGAPTQSGGTNPLLKPQVYAGAHWDLVTPFAMTRGAPGVPYFDPGLPAPKFQASDLGYAVEVAQRSSQLDDFGRVVAEFWAGGPGTETPAARWNMLANMVADSDGFPRQLGGTGATLDPLEWDVKMYFALNAGLHDAAVAAWGDKRIYGTARPITWIRHMADLGQSSDSSLPHYDPAGLPLVPGFIEPITAQSSAPGQPHEKLAPYVGELAMKAWRGEPADRKVQTAGVGWIRAREWFPYQRRTFVTPPSPGFVSGRSALARAAAEVLADLTGSPSFPGGHAEVLATHDTFLTIERGPSVDVHLSWATYLEAADQAGDAGLWAGISLKPDDLAGRAVGSSAGKGAVAKARTYFDGTAP